ncbi:MAG: exodeoxyribonuclease VII large subunit [Actinomycetota bacterium]
MPRTESSGDTFTVGELCDRVEQTITETFADEVWVQGAISGLSRSGNGHVYFDLVDPTDEVGSTTAAVLPVALFSSTRHLVNKILRKSGGMRMHDGIEIRIRGRVAYYPPQGRVQLVMSLIDPQFTLGQMVAAKTKLLDKLAADGLLDQNREVPFPSLPLRVALVTSDGSAAMADFVKQIEQSGFPFRITLLDSRVQGVEAVPSLTDAIRTCGELDVDVVVVARGGGSRTDLAAFDHERVATAIARSRHPVMVGVGHETDRSVADEVAHTSAKTPTACAAMLVGAVGAYAARVDQASVRLGALTALHLTAAREQLFGTGARLAGAARRVVERQDLELRHAGRRLHRLPGRHLELAGHRLTAGSARLDAVDPKRALQRGWTITHTADGTLVRAVEQVTPGTELRTTTMDGTISSRVLAVGHRDDDAADDSVEQAAGDVR